MKRTFVDIETTGLDCTKHNILSVGIAIVNVEKDNLEFIDKIEIPVVYENYCVDEKALQINKINLETHTGKTPLEAVDTIIEFLTKNEMMNKPICGHNINFDIGFLKKLFSSDKTYTYPFHYHKIDVMSILFYLQDKGSMPTNVRTLKALCNHFKITREKEHSALEDAMSSARTYYRLLNVMDLDDLE